MFANKNVDNNEKKNSKNPGGGERRKSDTGTIISILKDAKPGATSSNTSVTFAAGPKKLVNATESEQRRLSTASEALAISKKPHRTIHANKPQTRSFKGNAISSGKYSCLSFIPKFLFEQFRRYSNIFFLTISVMQQIPNVSPSGRWTTVVPFIFILTVSACKEILEDIKRHTADNATNNKEVYSFKSDPENRENPEPIKVKWSHIQVGDFVKVQDDQYFPCDLILYSSSEEDGICYVETSNLDGESNLKIRQALPLTAHLRDEDVPHLRGYIECEEPNRMLYEFLGKISLDGTEENALGPDQILLRGSKLMNTTWIIGQAIYTGDDTKLMKNANKVPLKQSTVDKNFSYGFILTLFTFVILFNSLIPISLTVTLEMVRFFQAAFINKDLDMYYEETDIPAVAKTSNLNEELGIIGYVFSDKTGTLTQNVMEFKGCSVSGVLFSPESIGAGDSSPLIDHITGKSVIAKDIRDFLTILAVCHTVIPDTSTGQLIYHASSPDERALVMGAKKYGFSFDSRSPQTVTIYTIINGESTKEVYVILNTLAFTSDRKRMSVVVRRPDGRLTLFCKGADMMVFDRLSEDLKVNSEDLKAQTQTHLDDFSKIGLRTLCLAVKELTETEYQNWNEEYKKAETNLSQKEKKLAELGEEIEKGLRLIGATAIEDKLQDEVPETIQSLLQAGINIWILTGDKQETAINIGRSCRLITPNMKIFLINQKNKRKTFVIINTYLEQLRTEFGETLPESIDAAVVIDGKTLHFATRKSVRDSFIQLCTSVRVVICCRSSPFQKAFIVGEVSQRTGKVTLAIGDGANDVAMIQKAHVGVGIAGVEGLQAASSSDYSIGQFKFLKKLLFVHGSWDYNRIGKVILYSFYKNFLVNIINLWFAYYSGFSGQILYDKWNASFFNLFFTATQPLALGFFEKNCRAEMRMKFPHLYVENQACFSMKVFLYWMVVAVAQSVIVFCVVSLTVGEGSIWGNGRSGGYVLEGNLMYTAVIVLVSLKAGVELKGWTLFSHVAIWGSIAFYMIFIIFYGLAGNFRSLEVLVLDIRGVAEMTYTSITFWLMLLIVVLLAYIPEISYHAFKHSMGKETEEDRCRLEDVNQLNQDSGEKLVLGVKSTHALLLSKSRASLAIQSAAPSQNPDLNKDIQTSPKRGSISAE